MDFLKNAVKDSGLTVVAFAQKVGVSRVTAHNWIRAGWVGGDHVLAAARVLGVDPMPLTRTAFEIRTTEGAEKCPTS